MSFKLGNKSRERMIGVDPRLIEIAEYALTMSLVDFGIPRFGGIRSVAQQQQLFLDGASKADGISKLSYHQSGRALDVFAYVDNKASWSQEHLAMVATSMLQAASMLGYQLTWGGLWKTKKSLAYGWDLGHFQLEE